MATQPKSIGVLCQMIRPKYIYILSAQSIMGDIPNEAQTFRWPCMTIHLIDNHYPILGRRVRRVAGNSPLDAGVRSIPSLVVIDLWAALPLVVLLVAMIGSAAQRTYLRTGCAGGCLGSRRRHLPHADCIWRALHNAWRRLRLVSHLLDRLSRHLHVPANRSRRQVRPLAGMPGRSNRGQPPSVTSDRLYLRSFL